MAIFAAKIKKLQYRRTLTNVGKSSNGRFLNRSKAYLWKMPKPWFLTVLTILLFAVLPDSDARAGATGGISLSFGTKVKRLGVFFDASNEGRLIINGGIRWYYCLDNLGPIGKRWESQLYFGGGYALGARRSERLWYQRFVNHPVENHSQYESSIAIAYLIYMDNIGTSQNTGQIGLQIQDFSLITENDIFAGGGTDKFRTGAFMLSYRYEDTVFGLSNILWTGDPKGKGYQRLKDEHYPSRFGYFNGSSCSHLGCSHGILVLQITQLLPYHQNIRIRLGIDSERIRNFVQNKVIHDMPFLPKSWIVHENPHIPMISKTGEAFLFQEDQELRASKFFYTFGANEPSFY